MADGEIEGKVRTEIRRFHEGGFDQYAAVEAIDCAIRDASAAQSALGRHTAWLQGVKRRRKDEVAKGEWPRARIQGAMDSVMGGKDDDAVEQEDPR